MDSFKNLEEMRKVYEKRSDKIKTIHQAFQTKAVFNTMFHGVITVRCIGIIRAHKISYIFRVTTKQNSVYPYGLILVLEEYELKNSIYQTVQKLNYGNGMLNRSENFLDDLCRWAIFGNESKRVK